MKYVVHAHNDAGDTFPTSLRAEIESAIGDVSVYLKRGAAAQIRAALLSALHADGWSDELLLSPGSNITITSAKSGVGLCLQTGNMARMYADLLKLQALYLNGAITCGALVLPSTPVATKLGSNIANASRLERELDIFKKVFNLPTLVFSLEE